jgi:hypothetical protein
VQLDFLGMRVVLPEKIDSCLGDLYIFSSRGGRGEGGGGVVGVARLEGEFGRWNRRSDCICRRAGRCMRLVSLWNVMAPGQLLTSRPSYDVS